nr:MAG TPA: hypothetical protein [Caudoviricetes sp.]
MNSILYIDKDKKEKCLYLIYKSCYDKDNKRKGAL